MITWDAGALLLGATDRAIGLVGRFAACFDDGRAAGLVEHTGTWNADYGVVYHLKEPEGGPRRHGAAGQGQHRQRGARHL